MEPLSFAAAKIRPPGLHVSLVERPALELRLQQAMEGRKLVTLTAPAGFGKTSALSRHLAQLPADTARVWITADADDNVARVIACLVAALEPYDVPWAVAPESLAALVATDTGLRTAATVIGRALAGADAPRGVLVVDDAHRFTDPRMPAFIDQLVRALPACWTLTLGARDDLPIARGRLLLDDQLAELRQADLCFDAGDVERLLRSALPVPAPGQVERLLSRTEGWAAGLRLCLEAGLNAAADAGADPVTRTGRRHLYDYLAAEVLEQLPADLRAFLLRCAVLPELSVERCQQLTGDPRAAVLLDELDRRGLFVSALDGPELTLRLHDLFREFLLDRLRHEQPGALPRLLVQAAASEPDLIRRIRMLADAEAWDAALQALNAAAPRLLVSQDSQQVAYLVDLFPATGAGASPWLAYWRGMAQRIRYDHVSARATMEAALRQFAAQGDLRMAARSRVQLAVSCFWTSAPTDGARHLQQLQQDTVDDHETRAMAEYLACWMPWAVGPLAAHEHIDRMLALLEAGSDPLLWMQCTMSLPAMLGREDMRRPLSRVVDGLRRVAGEEHPALQAQANLLDCGLMLFAGRLDEGEQLLQRVTEDARWLGQPQSIARPLLRLHAYLCAFRGDHAGTVQLCREMAGRVQASAGTAWSTHMELLGCAFLAAAVDEAALVRELLQHMQAHLPAVDGQLQQLRTNRAGARRPVVDLMTVLHARVAVLEGAVEISPELEQGAPRLKSELYPFALGLPACLITAQALVRRGSLAQAWALLQAPAQQLVPPDLLGVLLTAGRSVVADLAQAPWERAGLPQAALAMGGWRDALARLAPAGAAPLPAPAAASEPTTTAGAVAANDPVAGLSPRELQVLERLAAGDSNKLIARAFDLSPHTVKRHVARVLLRLDVSSRGQAADWYRRHRRQLPSHTPSDTRP